MDYGSEEGYQLFGPTNSPDKTQQFLDQASRQQDQNSANSRWLAEEQLQNTRNAGAGIMHGIDQGFSQYNTANDRADRNQQRGIENKRADINQGMDQTRLAMDQKTRGLQDTGYAQSNEAGAMENKNAQEKFAFRHGTEEGHAKSRGDELNSASYNYDLNKPIWERTQAELNNQATRSSMSTDALNRQVMTRNLQTSGEDRQINFAQGEYATAIKNHQAAASAAKTPAESQAADLQYQRDSAAIDAKYRGGGLMDSHLMTARNGAQTSVAGSNAVKEQFINASTVGMQALEKASKLDADYHRHASLVQAVSALKSSHFNSATQDAEIQKVNEALQARGRPENISNLLGAGDGLMPRARVYRATKAMEASAADLKNQLVGLKAQYQDIPSAALKAHIDSIEKIQAQIDKEAPVAGTDDLQMVGGPTPGSRFTSQQQGAGAGLNDGVQGHVQPAGTAPRENTWRGQ
jgi:hypothetical protein